MARNKNDATDDGLGQDDALKKSDDLADPEAGAEDAADELNRLEELDTSIADAETREPPMGDPDDGSSPAPGHVEENERRVEEVSASEAEAHEEEHGPSFASRALTWLVLLLAGAGIGIWAAPKIAPVLPSGMAPVAAWLTPGQPQSEARIADLETRLDAGLGDVSNRIADLAPAEDLPERIDAAVADVRTTLGAEIEDLRGRVAQVNDAETRQRIAALESAVEARAAEFESLRTQLTGGEAAIAGLSEEAVARIDTYQAEVEGLRAALAAQSDRVGELAARIDEVASEAARQIETAQSRVAEIESEAAERLTDAAAQSETEALRAALATGEPFADALAALSTNPAIEVPESLAGAADQGVSTLLELKDGFPDAAHQAIRASIMASAGEGLLGRSNAYLRAQIASRSLTPQDGMSPDAVLSRMEAELRADDLAGALAEADGLPSAATDAMAGWLDEARRRLATEEALDALNSALPATN